MTGEMQLRLAIDDLLAQRVRALVALDGMSAAGKTTLAAALCRAYPANVYHMDDFFLPPAARPPQWQQIPGGNMDLGRFKREVLDKLAQGEEVLYRPYCCRDGAMGQARPVAPRPLEIVEGAYATHPALGAPYHLTVFVAVDPREQRRRILARNGREGLARFEAIWIPMERRYFGACQAPDRCQMRITL